VTPARTRFVCVVAATAVAVTAPAGFAATKRKHPAKRPAGPKPGTVLWHTSGAFQHGYPRLTQAAWMANSCGGTTLGPEDTNNFSASVVDLSKWSGKQMSANFKPNTTDPANAANFSVIYYDASCNVIDVNDGKTGQWAGQHGKAAQAGLVPTGAKWALLQASTDSTQYETSPLDVAWDLTVRVPQPTDKATPMKETGGLPL